MDISPSGEFFTFGFENGEVQVRNFEKPEKYMTLKMHDGQLGRITAVKFDKDEKFILTTGEDGVMFAHLIDRENIKKEALFDPLEGVENLEYLPEE